MLCCWTCTRCPSMEHSPVFTVLYAHPERNLQLHGVLHLILHEGYGVCNCFFIIGALKDKLIVHLQQHVCRALCFIERGLHVNHCLLHNVGGASLNGRVQRNSFGALLLKLVAAVDGNNFSAAAHDCFNVAVLLCIFNCFVTKFVYSGVRSEICVYEILCFSPADAKLV